MHIIVRLLRSKEERGSNSIVESYIAAWIGAFKARSQFQKEVFGAPAVCTGCRPSAAEGLLRRIDNEKFTSGSQRKDEFALSRN